MCNHLYLQNKGNDLEPLNCESLFDGEKFRPSLALIEDLKSGEKNRHM
jgi:hypothetical protein